jgi:hypothetical protein
MKDSITDAATKPSSTVLVLNAGSSSLKYSLVEADTGRRPVTIGFICVRATAKTSRPRVDPPIGTSALLAADLRASSGRTHATCVVPPDPT